MARHHEIGRKGEELAALWLAGRGFQILARNWRHGRYEVDIIARLGGTCHFIEVKTGRTRKYGYPEERVGRKKIRDLMKAGAAWLYRFPGQRRVQYDVLSITCMGEADMDYLLIEDIHL
ncbi:MAG: YraN family protein [Bacteroidota bacterium]|nr:YraN family protein [Bacteroidota bacterium]